jgi:hypothetical protein
MSGAIPPLLSTPSRRATYLKKHSDSFIFTFINKVGILLPYTNTIFTYMYIKLLALGSFNDALSTA